MLVGVSHPGNVGAAARALKVMGFRDLVLVNPRHDDVLTREETRALASGADDVLDRARCVGSLTQALEGVTHACATAMTPRDFGPPVHAPRERLPSLAAAGQGLGFVFGSERYGLSNEDVYRCHTCLSIPTDPAYGSLNLAQAVQILAYEWRLALGGYAVTPRAAAPRRAAVPAVEGLLAHWTRALIRLEFLDPAVPRKLLPRLHRLLQRAEVTEEEVHILRGVARAVEARCDEADRWRAGAPPQA